jgi:transcriptional regulator with XRE-family HTH domain
MTSPPVWRIELGAAIKAARKAAELSQQDLAAALGVRQPTVSQWERGGTAPRTKHLFRLLRLLGPRLICPLLRDEDMATPVDSRNGRRHLGRSRPFVCGANRRELPPPTPGGDR